MHTKESLKRDLERLGLWAADTALVHSSMKAIGAVENRADGALDALTEYFAPGLLALPTLTWTVAAEKPPVFDVRRTKSIVGLLTELFRHRPGVVRSLHPTHSVAALGRDAEWFTGEDHLNNSPCSFTSSWHKLLERDARILMVGCDLTRCTFLHGVEEWANVPNRLEPAMAFTVIDEAGTARSVSSSPHRGNPSEQFWKAEEALRGAGALWEGKFGDARTLVLSAKKTYEVVEKLLLDNPDLFSEA